MQFEIAWPKLMSGKAASEEEPMLPQNDYLVKCEFLDYRMGEVQADAKQRQLIYEGGIVTRPWLTCQLCRALHGFGHALITVGRRLEQQFAPAV